MPSVEELQAIEEAAHAEGYARGHAEGVAAGQAEVRRIARADGRHPRRFTRPLARLDARGRRRAGRPRRAHRRQPCCGRGYAAEPALLDALVREALELAGSDQRQVELRLHPDDLAMLDPQLLALRGRAPER